MTICVCGHEAAEHHAWTGACTGPCGCSYFLEDNGIEPTVGTVISETYNGIYAMRKWT